MSIDSDSQAEESGGSSLEPLSFVYRVKQRWAIAGIGLAISLVGGLAGGAAFGSKAYRTETILFFRPSKAADEDSQLMTQLNLVKTRENLEDVRSKLKLTGTLEQLSGALTVDVERNTQLLSITGTGSSPEAARDLAVSLREAFISRQEGQRRKKIQSVVDGLDQRLQQVNKELRQSELKLQKFTVDNRVVDLDKEAQWYLQQLTSLQILYEQAQVERASVKIQAGNIDKIMQDLKDRIAKEKAESSAMDNLGDINIRAQRLRDLIHDDTSGRAGMALLKEKQVEYERAQRLHQKGLISQTDLERAQSAFESQKALSIDTPQVKEWKGQLEKYNALAVPKGNTAPPSGTVLQSMTLKSFDIQLNLVTQDQKVKKLLEAIEACQKRLDALPRLQRDFAALKRDLDTLAQEKTRLENLIAEKKQNLESNLSDFGLAQEAGLPVLPFKSNRKLVFAGFMGIGAFVTLIVVILSAWFDRKVRTGKELALWAGVGSGFAVGPLARLSNPTEMLKVDLAVRELLHKGVQRHTWLITSPSDGIESDLDPVITAVAVALQKAVGTVLVIRSGESGLQSLEQLSRASSLPTQKDGSVEFLTLTPGLYDSLTGVQVSQLLDSLHQKYPAVLAWAKPLQHSTQAELWGEYCSGCVLLEKAGHCTRDLIQTAGRRLLRVFPDRQKVVALLYDQSSSFAGVDKI